MNHNGLPSDWKYSTIGELAQVSTGRTPSRTNPMNFGGDIPWVKTAEVADGVIHDTDEHLSEQGKDDSKSQIFPAGSILVALYGQGQTRGRTALLGVPAATNQACAVILPSTRADKHFLWWWLRASYVPLREMGRGGTQPNLNLDIVRTFGVPVPPLPEQRRIVAILDKANANRRKRAEGIRLTEELLRSTFLEMFGDPATNPKGWQISLLGSATELVTSGLTPTGGSTVYVDAGPLFIRSQNVLMNRLDLSDVAFLPEAIHASMSRTKVLEGDVLLNITGASIGRVASVETLPGEANVNQHVCIIRLDRKKATPEFVSVCISFSFGQRQIDNMQSGASRQGLNHQQVRSLKIPLPPLSLQQRYSREVSMLRKMNAKREQGRTASEELFQSLVQRAFRGEL